MIQLDFLAAAARDLTDESADLLRNHSLYLEAVSRLGDISEWSGVECLPSDLHGKLALPFRDRAVDLLQRLPRTKIITAAHNALYEAGTSRFAYRPEIIALGSALVSIVPPIRRIKRMTFLSAAANEVVVMARRPTIQVFAGASRRIIRTNKIGITVADIIEAVNSEDNWIYDIQDRIFHLSELRYSAVRMLDGIDDEEAEKVLLSVGDEIHLI